MSGDRRRRGNKDQLIHPASVLPCHDAAVLRVGPLDDLVTGRNAERSLPPFRLAGNTRLLAAADGTLVRKLGLSSDDGWFLDILADRSVEFAVVIGLYLYAPERGFLLLILLGSFYLCVTTFLLSGIFERNLSKKSFHYSPGLIERAETFIYFPIVIIFEETFFWGTIIFATLVFFTAFKRFFEMLRAYS